MRRSRSRVGQLAHLGLVCSTPEGIDAAITRSLLADTWVDFGVLNARRHRCGDHSSWLSDGALALRCSTPEGIDAAITGAQSWSARNCFCAQRPKASMRRSPPELLSLYDSYSVLNARRHRCGDHCKTLLAGETCWNSAQRPKASMRRSQP